jgi:glycosyltransferase involved in cell wall biosynthesis
LRILAINWQDIANPQAGGAELHITEILKGLVKRGHQATLFCSGFSGAPAETEQEGIKVIRRGSRYNFNWVLPFHLGKILKKQQFDLVLEDINKMPFFSPLFHRIPTLVMIMHFFGKSILQETNFIFGSYVLTGEMLVPLFYRNFPFLTISESSKEELVERGIKADRITVVSPGISDIFYNYHSNCPKAKVPTILYVGRIKKYKGVQFLIKALVKVREKLPEAELRIVGSGDYLIGLKDLVNSLKLQSGVKFAGFVSEEEKIKLYHEAWVSVYPSLKEGWGLTNIEANACRTPVLASNMPGLRDSVIDGETGLLFRYGDVDDLADKLIRILSDREFSVRLSQGGLAWARKFSWEQTAQRVYQLMERVTNRGRK